MATASNAKRAGSKRSMSIEPLASDSLEEMVDPKLAPSLNTTESTFITIWHDPFDVTKLPQGISLDLIKRAPFLLGSDEARYPTSFFKNTGGLCARSYKFKELSNDDLFPLEDLTGTYPLSKKGNRHPLKLIKDRQTARDALHMYQRGTQPDNGEFGTSFIRGLALFYQKNEDLNWAERAAELAKCRAKSPGKNPQKLMPPCLREQIQAMIHTFAHYLLDAYMRIGPSPQKRSDVPRLPPTQSPTVGSLQSRRSINLGVHATRPTPPVVSHDMELAPTIICEPKPTRMRALIAKHHEAEASLNRLLQRKEKLEITKAE